MYTQQVLSALQRKTLAQLDKHFTADYTVFVRKNTLNSHSVRPTANMATRWASLQSVHPSLFIKDYHDTTSPHHLTSKPVSLNPEVNAHHLPTAHYVCTLTNSISCYPGSIFVE